MCYSEEVGGGCIVEYPPKPWIPTNPEEDEIRIKSDSIWKVADCDPATDDDWDSETAEEQENLPENY